MVSEGWIEIALENIIEIRNGKTSPARVDSGIFPVFGSNGIIGFSNDFNSESETIIIGRVGAYCGSVYYHKGKCWVTDNALCCKVKEKFDVLFIYHYLKLLNLNSFSGGSSQPLLNQSILNSIIISIPRNKEHQHRISGILSALDDKIELNRQTNATLEAIAQAIFKEWFVDFNYPGATGEMIESELGPIPKGWRVGKLGEICKITMGQSPPGESYNEDGIGTPFFQGRADFGFRFPSKRVFTTNPKRFANKFDTLVSVRAPVGDMNIATENCCIGRGLAAVIERNGCYSFTYYFLKEFTEQLKGFEDNGTVFGSINKNDFEGLTCIFPTIDIITSFEENCRVIDDEIFNLEQESRTLTIIRDAILPKLMSSEIEL